MIGGSPEDRHLHRLARRPQGPQGAARIVKRLLKIEISGHLGDNEPVGEGVRELRFHFGPGYRVYFTQQGEVVIILLCGGDKDSQERDIARAKEIAKALAAPDEIGPRGTTNDR